MAKLGFSFRYSLPLALDTNLNDVKFLFVVNNLFNWMTGKERRRRERGRFGRRDGRDRGKRRKKIGNRGIYFCHSYQSHLRPYRDEPSASRPIRADKHRRGQRVLTWVTSREHCAAAGRITFLLSFSISPNFHFFISGWNRSLFFSFQFIQLIFFTSHLTRRLFLLLSYFFSISRFHCTVRRKTIQVEFNFFNFFHSFPKMFILTHLQLSKREGFIFYFENRKFKLNINWVSFQIFPRWPIDSELDAP